MQLSGGEKKAAKIIVCQIFGSEPKLTSTAWPHPPVPPNGAKIQRTGTTGR
jgi:hypothetical protein